jgi:hypothetical protein
MSGLYLLFLFVVSLLVIWGLGMLLTRRGKK